MKFNKLGVCIILLVIVTTHFYIYISCYQPREPSSWNSNRISNENSIHVVLLLDNIIKLLLSTLEYAQIASRPPSRELQLEVVKAATTSSTTT